MVCFSFDDSNIILTTERALLKIVYLCLKQGDCIRLTLDESLSTFCPGLFVCNGVNMLLNNLRLLFNDLVAFLDNLL